MITIMPIPTVLRYVYFPFFRDEESSLGIGGDKRSILPFAGVCRGIESVLPAIKSAPER